MPSTHGEDVEGEARNYPENNACFTGRRKVLQVPFDLCLLSVYQTVRGVEPPTAAARSARAADRRVSISSLSAGLGGRETAR